MNFTNIFYESVEKNRDRIAIIEDGQEIKYGELFEKIDKLSRGLSSIGVKPGDRVALILPNSKDYIISFFAILRLNAIVIPLEPIFTTSEYVGFFSEVSPAYLITTSYIITKVLAYERSLVFSRKLIITDNDQWVTEKFRDSTNFDSLYEEGSKTQLPEIVDEEDSIASINYTYRGYGYPIGAALMHSNYSSCTNSIASMGWLKGDTFLSVLPMAHIFALICYVLVPLISGAKLIIVKSHAAWGFFEAIDKYKADLIIGVPTFFSYLMKSYDSSKFDISSVKYGVSGGSYLSPELNMELEKGLGIKIFQGYGLTEGLIVSSNTLENNKMGSLGRPDDNTTVKIIDDDGNEVTSVGKKGEIVVKSPSVMTKYYNRERETADVLKEDWLYTGDYGNIDSNGYIYFEGLKKNIAKIGGHCVDLREVESVLLSHPHISDVKIYADSDKFWGGIIVAEVHLGIKTAADDLYKFCTKQLSVYKIPKKINIVEKD
ncbi:MAG: class I adenylate-forming enzyme family protein [Elusimicrobiota bacterium]